jgi:hypothetical protein
MTFDMSPDAEKLLDIMLEEFRKEIAPLQAPEDFREAARCLLSLGLAKIYQRGDHYTFEPTPEGQAMGMLQ